MTTRGITAAVDRFTGNLQAAAAGGDIPPDFMAFMVAAIQPSFGEPFIVTSYEHRKSQRRSCNAPDGVWEYRIHFVNTDPGTDYSRTFSGPRPGYVAGRTVEGTWR